MDPEPEAVRQARHRWAELLRHIFEVDPLACPRCGEQMRIVVFITEPKVIDRILDHRDAPRQLADTRALRPDAGSPALRLPRPDRHPGRHFDAVTGVLFPT